MAGRRKRAAPAKLDDEAKKQLCWNMHEDRRNDPTLEVNESDLDASTSFSFVKDKPESLFPTLGPENVSSELCTEGKKEPDVILTQVFTDLTILNSLHQVDVWKVLLGIFSIYFKSTLHSQTIFQGHSFTLTRNAPQSAQLLLCAYKSGTDEDDEGTMNSCRKNKTEELMVETSVGDQFLED